MRIKAEVFPYEDVDIEALLRDLASKRNGNKQPEFLIRYSRPEGKFIQIVNFQKHQNPHVKEAPSTIPAPDSPGASTVQVGESTVRATLTPSSPIPDSPLLTPDSPSPEPGASTGRAPGKKFTPPTAEEVQTYLDEVGERRFTGEAFVDAYRLTGWKAKGGNPIKDWPAAVRNWRHIRDQRGEVQSAPKVKPQVLCRDCHEAMTKIETMEGTTCRACREDHGV